MAKVEVVMPQMGESVMEGTVIEWSKKVGDKVEVDETLLEIATDKIDTEVPSPESGILTEILVQEDETVQAGQVIAIIETEAGAANSAKDLSEHPDTPDKTDEHSEQNAESSQQTTAPLEDNTETVNEDTMTKPDQGNDQGGRIEIVMPQMGESVMEGEIIEWLKNIGDSVEADEPLLEIATDKIDTEVPSPESGILLEILVESGDVVEVGQPIAVIGTGDAASAAPAAAQESTDESTTESGSAEEAPAEEAPAEEQAPAASAEDRPELKSTGSDGRFFSPLVRSIAKEEGISQEELESISGSGKDGRVSKEDILNFLEERKAGEASTPQPAKAPSSPSSQPAAGKDTISAGELDVSSPHGNIEIIKMDRMRKTIAEHMVRSKQTSAHVTTFNDVDVTNIVKWRNANKKKFQEQTGIKLTFTPIFIEAFIQAVGEFPLMNSSVDGDEIHLKKDINFGIAVALGEGGKGGLIVPVIKQAQDKNLAGLAKSVYDLATRAREKNLNPDDLVGGTITLTNYGSVGNLMGTPIINQPQVAILGTGIIEKRPVVMETEDGDMIAIRHRMYLTMSYDHRIIDGAHGGAFMRRVKQLLEEFDPNRVI